MPTLLFRVKMQEEKRDEALAALATMAKKVESDEPKARAYLMHTLRDDPSMMVLFESYDDQDGFDNHMQTPHMGELRGALGTLFDMSQMGVERVDWVKGFSRGTPNDGSVAVIFRAAAQPGKEQQAADALSNMVQEVEKNEPDTLAYVLTRANDNPAQMAVFEVYKDQQTFEAHQKTPHMDTMRGAFGELFDGSTVKIEWLERIAGHARALPGSG
jgi:quinol monooxygenase YgiN